MSANYRTRPPLIRVPSGRRLVNVTAGNGWATRFLDTTNTAKTSRVQHDVRLDCRNIRLVFPSVYSDGSTGSELSPGNCFELTASIEDSAGNIYPVMFGGRRLATVGAGGLIVSDPLAIKLQAGDAIYSRTFCHRLISNTYNTQGEVGRLAANQTNLVRNYSAVTLRPNSGITAVSGTGVDPFLTDATLSGTITDATNFTLFVPCAIIGETEDDRLASMAFVGDSITAGGASYTTTYPGTGWVGQTGNNAPVMNLGRSGDRLSYFKTFHARIRSALVDYADVCYLAMGINDISAGDSLATVQANFLAAVALLRQHCRTVVGVTVTPRSTSSDGWETVGNQTPFAQDSVRSAFNAWLMTSEAGLDGYFNAASIVEDPSGGVWQAGTLVETGTSTSGGATTITDTSKTWTVNEHAGRTVRNVTTSETRLILTNTSNTLAVDPSWSAGAGNTFRILDGLTRDGLHPSQLAEQRIAAAFTAPYYD